MTSQWAKTIQPKSDQLNADDLIGGNKVIIIRDVKVTDAPDQPASIFYEGDNGKPYKPCKTMRKLMAHCWGLNEQDYIGRSMELFRDDSVTWAGEAVGGIRIKAMSHIAERKRISLQISRNKKMPFVIEPLKVTAQPDDAAQKAGAYSKNLIASFALAEDHHALEQIWNSSLKALDKLKANYKPLYIEIEKSYLKRKGEIEPAFYPDPEEKDDTPERDDKTDDMFE